MKRSKHFRKDVILARVIFFVLCILIGVLISLGVSALKKNFSDEDTQQTESQETEEYYIPDYQDTEIDTEITVNETETEPEEEVVYYAQTTAEVRMRVEPNTNCNIVTIVPAWTKTLLVEEVAGWYKVSYNGQEGYIRADYIQIIEETVSSNGE